MGQLQTQHKNINITYVFEQKINAINTDIIIDIIIMIKLFFTYVLSLLHNGRIYNNNNNNINLLKFIDQQFCGLRNKKL
jgi:hypothetical protein